MLSVCTSLEMQSGWKPASSIASAVTKPKGSRAVSDIEEDAALARRDDLFAHLAGAGARAPRERGGSSGSSRRRGAGGSPLRGGSAGGCPGGTSPAAGLVRHFQREIQRRHAPAFARGHAHPHLDADDEVGVPLRDIEADLGMEKAEVAALADHYFVAEGEDAGERDVEVGMDARLDALDDVGAKAVEVAGPCAARVHHGGGAGLTGVAHRVDPERGAAQ